MFSGSGRAQGRDVADLLKALQVVLDVAIPLYAISSMFVTGARFSIREILQPFRHWQGAVLLLVGNFILVPLLGYGVAHMVSAHPPLAVGLVLAASAAGAPFLLQLIRVAGGNLALSSGLLVVLTVVTIITMPFLVPLAAPQAVIPAAAIAVPLLLTMLVPLVVGGSMRTIFPRLNQRAWPIVSQTAVLSFYVLVILTLALNVGDVIALVGTGAILAAAILIAGAYGIGFVTGRLGGEHRAEVGLATAQRNIGAATVVALESFHDPDVLVMVIVTGLVTLAVLIPISVTVRRNRLRRLIPFHSPQGPRGA